MNAMDSQTLRQVAQWFDNDARGGSPPTTDDLADQLGIPQDQKRRFAESLKRLVVAAMLEGTDVTNQSSSYPEYFITGVSSAGLDHVEAVLLAEQGAGDGQLAGALDEAHQTVIETIYDALVSTSNWPKYKFVAKMVDARTRQDFDDVLGTMPDELLSFNPLSLQYSEFALTVAGLRRCRVPGAADDLVFFLRCVQWFVDREHLHMPESATEPEDARATSLEAVSALTSGGVGPGSGHIRRLYKFIEQDPRLFGGGSYSPETGDWEVIIPPRVKLYRGVNSIDDYLERHRKDQEPRPNPPRPPVRAALVSGLTENARVDSIFLVHGHATGPKEQVARFLGAVTKVDVTILHEQVSAGRTVIEKFEQHAGRATFAVVLLTADDLGRAKEDEALTPRARQNVILEWGYFLGKVGRGRVAVLYEPEVELPSDIKGLIYIQLDSPGAWKLELAKELKAAGMEVDFSKMP
jgi:hypothetical protein